MCQTGRSDMGSSDAAASGERALEPTSADVLPMSGDGAAATALPRRGRRAGPVQLFVRRPARVIGSPLVSNETDSSASSARPSLPRIGLLIETQVGPGRDILRGVARYVRESGPWALHLEARNQLFVEG